MPKVKRSELRTFIDTTPESTETWGLLGEGVPTSNIEYNPEISEETYIHEDAANKEIERYAPSQPVEATAIKGDAVFDFIDSLRKGQAVLDAAHTQIVNVFLYETIGTNGYPAELIDVTIAIESFGGDGGESAKINYTIHYRGDPVEGEFDVDTLTFTANP
jgi:hypothetical protein